ncbi:MAG: hypothetical protein HYV63_32270 [Candidatus Schekmanbacteria bacterium]|nr:hypothetical protein [Candidatus Schekmanbacteria bacterium]
MASGLRERLTELRGALGATARERRELESAMIERDRALVAQREPMVCTERLPADHARRQNASKWRQGMARVVQERALRQRTGTGQGLDRPPARATAISPV